jgi:hypothetical protein
MTSRLMYEASRARRDDPLRQAAEHRVDGAPGRRRRWLARRRAHGHVRGSGYGRRNEAPARGRPRRRVLDGATTGFTADVGNERPGSIPARTPTRQSPRRCTFNRRAGVSIQAATTRPHRFRAAVRARGKRPAAPVRHFRALHRRRHVRRVRAELGCAAWPTPRASHCAGRAGGRSAVRSWWRACESVRNGPSRGYSGGDADQPRMPAAGGAPGPSGRSGGTR